MTKKRAHEADAKLPEVPVPTCGACGEPIEHLRWTSATAPMTYTIAQAAERLGGPFTARWLRSHLAQVPHLRTGEGTGRAGRIGFAEEHLAAIVAMFTVEGKPVPGPEDFTTSLSRRRRQPPPPTQPITRRRNWA